VAEPVVVIPFDGWGREVTGLIAARAPAVRFAAGPAGLEALGVPFLTVERDGHAVWVGPTVVPGHPGCHRCAQARRRQHAGSLPPVLAPVAAEDPEVTRLAARAVLAVLRRVLAAPEAEAGVTRRFVAGGTPPLAGRVVPVSGCARCHRLTPFVAGWSLRAGAVTTTA